MKKIIPSYIRVLLLFFFVFGALEFFIDSGNKPAFLKFPMVSVFLFVFLFLLIAIEISLLLPHSTQNNRAIFVSKSTFVIAFLEQDGQTTQTS